MMYKTGTTEHTVKAGHNREQAYHHRTAKLHRMRIAKRRQMRCRKYFLCVLTLALIAAGTVSTHSFHVKAKSNHNEQTLYKYYKNIEVQPNDTLWDLAIANYCEEKQTVQEYISEVQKINHLDDERMIAGNHIVLPYYSTEFIYY